MYCFINFLCILDLVHVFCCVLSAPNKSHDDDDDDEILTVRSWQSAGDHIPSRPGHPSTRPGVGSVVAGYGDGGGLRRHSVTVGRLGVARVASATQRQPATSHLQPEKYSAAQDDHQRRPQHAATPYSHYSFHLISFKKQRARRPLTC